METILIPPATELFFGKGLIQTLLPELCKKFRTAIIADESVKDLFTEGEVFVVPRGEASKTREMKANLEDQLLARGFGRDTVIVAVGGGVTLDLSGYLASTYMRGVPFISVPTTLLAMVDASIGGKNGVNTPRGKNLIGTFYPPKAIVTDLDVLKTLPEKEMVNGRAEMMKMALISDASILDGDVLKAIRAKIDVVTKDPNEKGLRRILNFGHTIGHALELKSNYTLSHGEAVSMGCLAESFLSMHLGYLPKSELERIISVFPRYKWAFDGASLIKAMKLDKKAAAGQVRSVLIDRIGRALPFDGAYCAPISDEDFHAAFEWMEKNGL